MRTGRSRNTFVPDDVAGCADSSNVSVKVVVPSGVDVPTVNSYVAVTGISSCEKIGDVLHRLLRVRGTEDIVPM